MAARHCCCAYVRACVCVWKAQEGDGSNHVEKQIQALVGAYEKTIAPAVMQQVEEVRRQGRGRAGGACVACL